MSDGLPGLHLRLAANPSPARSVIDCLPGSLQVLRLAVSRGLAGTMMDAALDGLPGLHLRSTLPGPARSTTAGLQVLRLLLRLADSMMVGGLLLHSTGPAGSVPELQDGLDGLLLLLRWLARSMAGLEIFLLLSALPHDPPAWTQVTQGLQEQILRSAGLRELGPWGWAVDARSGLEGP
jgi:hypothetical protein